jgi:hypothetical protein
LFHIERLQLISVKAASACEANDGFHSAGRSSAQREEQAVTRAYGLAFAVFAIGIAAAPVAHAHSLRLECKKITIQDVVCRAITSDGELARDIEIQLLATGDYRVLAIGKTNAAGEYAFKMPDAGYHIVATGDKAHVTSMASVDIW